MTPLALLLQAISPSVYTLQYNYMNILEDIWIPIRGSSIDRSNPQLKALKP